jgi:hypothetical protein
VFSRRYFAATALTFGTITRRQCDADRRAEGTSSDARLVRPFDGRSGRSRRRPSVSRVWSIEVISIAKREGTSKKYCMGVG